MVLFSKIAEFARAELDAEIHHDHEDVDLRGFVPADAWAEGKIVFCKSVDERLFAQATALTHRALIVQKDQPLPACPCILVSNPRYAYARISNAFFTPPSAPSIHPTVVIDDTAQVHSTATIGAHCVIGADVVIGPYSVLHNHVVIARNVKIGAECVILSQSVIGELGFGVEAGPAGDLVRLPHTGGVVIGDRVHVGSLNSIASGTMTPTVIEDNVQFDNLVHVAHNVKIGQNCQITACVEISGSVTIGRNVWVGPNSSIMQKVTIGDNSIIGLGAVVRKSLPENVSATGVPARVIRTLQPPESEG